MFYQRLLKSPSGKTFFLFGPRGVGKSTWVMDQLKFDLKIDLLENQVYLDLFKNPSKLESMVGHLSKGKTIFIDEVQKIPPLLDEVHRLIESKRLIFILTGSSARKLKRFHANLLGGRAQTRKMFPLSIQEVGDKVKVNDLIAWGSLPLVLENLDEPMEVLTSYVDTYLKEEIKEEALVRKIDEFARFLEVAGNLNGQILNFENISRECGKSGKTILSWYRILEDTLLGFQLPSFRPGFKVREVIHSKFYWFDQGVARAAAGLAREDVDSLWLGSALETHVLKELMIYNEVSRKIRPIYFYSTPGAGEVDFIIETQKKTIGKDCKFLSIEVKNSKTWNSKFEKPSRQLKEYSGKSHERMIGVYLGDKILTSNKFEVFPLHIFINKLFKGEIF